MNRINLLPLEHLADQMWKELGTNYEVLSGVHKPNGYWRYIVQHKKNKQQYALFTLQVLQEYRHVAVRLK